MLAGPTRPRLPDLLNPDTAGIKDILDYLKQMQQVLDAFFSTIIGDSVGIIGTRGLSSTGTAAANFTKSGLAIGNTTQMVWSFPNAEMDASYMIYETSTAPPSVWLRSITKSTASVTFNFGAVVPSGIVMDVVLLR